MVDSGIWSPIDKAECAYGMVVVAKKDGGVRVTTDLSPLNKFVIPDRHPLPHIEDLLVKLGGMRWFSKIDLRKGYFHIPLHLDSRRYTAYPWLTTAYPWASRTRHLPSRSVSLRH